MNKSVQEIAEEVCGLYTELWIKPNATIDGIKWNCEIFDDDGVKCDSIALAEEKSTMEDAMNEAYKQWLIHERR